MYPLINMKIMALTERCSIRNVTFSYSAVIQFYITALPQSAHIKSSSYEEISLDTLSRR